MNPFAKSVLAFSAILVIILCAVTATVSISPGVYISGVCAHNDEIMYDRVGFYHDYIELTNASKEPVSLKGYGLSDERSRLKKYTFDDIVLEPDAAITVWADDRLERMHGYKDEEALFTGFRLRDHETLFLTDAKDNVIDTVRLPSIDKNKVLVRSAAGDRGTEAEPEDPVRVTPDVSNLVKTPVLSAQSGFYDGPFELTIDGGGNTVFYTLDGSSPYTSGVRYENEAIPVYDRSPLPNYYSSLVPVTNIGDQYVPMEPVSKAMIIRAISCDRFGSFSREAVGVFYIGDEIRSLCRGTYILSIVSDPEGLFSGASGIYVTGNLWDMNREMVEDTGKDPVYAPTNYNMRGKGWRRDARLTLFDPEGNRLYDEDDLITIRGKSSRQSVQKGFNLRPAKPGDRVFDGLFENAGDTLSIRCASEEDVYVTNMRDALNTRLIRDMKLGATDPLCCQVYLNGEYWGCYDLRQHLDESYIEALYGVDAGNVNLIKNDEAESGTPSDQKQYDDVEAFALRHDFSDDKYYRQFCDMVDIDSLIDFYCANIFLANDDAYVNNHALWRARVPGPGKYEDGKWYHLLFDLDNTDGYLSTSYVDVDSFVYGNGAHADPLNEETYFPNLWKNPSFRKQFSDRFTYLINNDFSYERTGPVIDEMEQTYTIPMVMSVRRFSDLKFKELWFHENVAIIRDFFERRGDIIYGFMMKHLGE